MKNIVPMLFIFMSGCVGSTTDAARLIQEDNIRETLFRYQFDHNASGQQKRATVYCLSVGKKQSDPSDDFMNRFASHKPPVRKVSECQANRYKGVVDKRTGTPGLIFRVDTITWISDTEAEATGGYYEAGLSASGNTYTVIKQHGEWKVSSDRMNWLPGSWRCATRASSEPETHTAGHSAGRRRNSCASQQPSHHHHSWDDW